MTKHTEGPDRVYSSDDLVADALEMAIDHDKLKTINAELLAALEYILAVCPAIDDIGEEARNEARVAIAKAKGEL